MQYNTSPCLCETFVNKKFQVHRKIELSKIMGKRQETEFKKEQKELNFKEGITCKI